MSLRSKRVEYIVIEKKTVTYNSVNEEVVTWQPAANLDNVADSSGGVYAEQHFKGGDESVKDGQMLAYQKVIWKTDVMDSLNPNEYRITFDGDSYDIENVWQIRRHSSMIKTQKQDNK